MEIHGFCEPRWTPLKEALAANFADGLDTGASLAVMRNGRMEADLWAGWAVENERPWAEDTIVCVLSSTKLPLVLAFLMLVDRGLVDLDAPIARYWPEFAAGGKDKSTVRQALTHRDGVPGFNPPITPDTLLDWDATCANIAAEDHWFGGVDKISYHPVTYGFVLGEIMRRTDGRKPAQFVREEIAQRGGIDLQIGLASKDQLARIAHYKWPSEPPPVRPPDHEGTRINASAGGPAAPSWERMSADISAGNGYTNARAMAQLASIFALGGELNGVRYLSRSLVDEALSLQVTGDDWLFGPINMCLGFSLDSEPYPAPTRSTVHWGGAGGSQTALDPRTGVGYAFAMNQIHFAAPHEDGPRFTRLWNALGETMRALG